MHLRSNTIAFSILISILIACGKSNKKEEIILDNDSIKIESVKFSSPPKIYSDTRILDTLLLNLDDNDQIEKIIITEGYYDMENYKFEIYNDSNIILGTLYSQNENPWIDSIENQINPCKILWAPLYLNGSDCGGDVYYGYKLINNKLKQIISIPALYYGCYSMDAPEGYPFYWGNIKLNRIEYHCPKSIDVTIKLDLHEAPSWELMDSISKTKYEKNHILIYSWIPDKKAYLVKSPNGKTTYDIQTVYDMTDYLEKEFGLKWK